MKKYIFTFVLAIVSSVWMTNEASNWCMPAAQTSTEQPIRIGGTFQTDIFPCVDETEPCPPCLTIVLASGGHYYLVSDDPQIVATLDTVTIGSFAIIEGIHYLLEHHDYINVTHIFFPEIDMTQLTGEWEVYKETVSTPTGDAGTRWFSTHDVNNTNYIIENNSIYKVVLDQASGYAHYSDIVPYSIERKEDGTWLLTAEGLFSSANPVDEGIPTPVTIYKLTENEIEWVFAANGGDEGPNYYYQYLRRYTNTQNDKLPSLCDEWNVLVTNISHGPRFVSFSTLHYRLTTDTIINRTRYVCLEQSGEHIGAMREGDNRDIYYIPAGGTHEYLLYAFNAQTGDTLYNMWVSERLDRYNGKRATIREIQDTDPRTFVVKYEFTYNNDKDTSWLSYDWIEGVGMSYGPSGDKCPFDCAGDFGEYVLCAYKNNQQVYVSEWGEKYGCEYNYDPSQPMFPSDTKWHYVYTEMYGGPDFKPRYFSVSPIDTVINNTHYQKINGILFRSDATKVWCVIDSMDTRIERLVYDFDLQVGDSIRKLCYGYDGYWTEEPYCEESRYAKVTNVEYIQLGDGRMARRLSYDNRPDDIEHIGCVDGIFAPLNFPVSTCGCGDYFQCCTRGDVLMYEVESGACDTFFIKEQPTDTIPLYARDDSGSSTVDPVDPNQIYATLTGNVLTIHNRTGVQVTFTLNNTSVNNVVARVRKNGQPTTFTESISVELTEDGIYEILLTSEEWNYSIFGTFNHVRSSTSTTKQDPALTTKKLLRGTQILIERGNKTYTLTGQEVK